MRDYESIIRRLINDRNESPKVDFKSTFDPSTRRDTAELAKLTLAIANTDSDELEDIGYVVIGAARGRLLGGADALADDNARASLVTKLNNYIDPPLRSEVKAFLDAEHGWFGAIVIKPSFPSIRPHFVKKEFSDEKETVFRRNECYVRRAEYVELAGPSDYIRMYQPRFWADLEAAKEKDVREPVPSVTWLNDGRDEAVLVIPPFAGLAETVRRLPEAISEHPELNLSGEVLKAAQEYNVKVRNYNEALSEFPANYERWRRLMDGGNLAQIRVWNRGTAPLQGGMVYLMRSDAIELVADRGFEEPRLPPRPLMPESLSQGAARPFERLLAFGQNLTHATTLLGGVGETNFGNPLDLDNHDGMVVGTIRQLKHGFGDEFGTRLIVVPLTGEGEYKIECRVYADNLPKPAISFLTVKVVESAPRRSRHGHRG